MSHPHPAVISGSRAESPHRRGFGLYIHWPFCLAKCPYCDFNSHVRAGIAEDAWRRALLAELDHYAAFTPGRVLDSIFFGGGTPSLMPPAIAARLIERAAGHWRFAADIEISLEANPTSAEAAKFAAFRQAGVNRLSLGVQALDDAALKFLGRRHDAGQALAALDLARRRFPRFSVDLIYARPRQSPVEWRRELERAMTFAPDHLSLYQLTIEPGTAFAQAAARGDLTLPEEEVQAELYEITQELTAAAGLTAYEISNHARGGEESRHNLVYWRYGDYVGIGPGAHGRLTLDGGKIATRQHRAPEIWLERVLAAGHATQQRAALSRDERLAEMLMMGLRLTEGIPLTRFAEELEDRESIEPSALHRRFPKLARLVAGGFLAFDEERLAATFAGRQRLNAVLGELLG